MHFFSLHFERDRFSDHDQRHVIVSSLREALDSCKHALCVVAGDFNMVFTAEDRVSWLQNEVVTHDTTAAERRWHRTFEDLSCCELRDFTWSNRTSTSLAVLDNVYINLSAEVLAALGLEASTQPLESLRCHGADRPSDHRPVLLQQVRAAMARFTLPAACPCHLERTSDGHSSGHFSNGLRCS